jgi:hypothetical protein
VDIGKATATDVCDASPDISNDAPQLFRLGTTTVTWSATDDSKNVGHATQQVKIVDTTPPDLTVQLSPTVLWPPDHNLVTITATITVTDKCDPNPTIRLVSITSNEPDNGLGDGDQPNDMQATFGYRRSVVPAPLGTRRARQRPRVHRDLRGERCQRQQDDQTGHRHRPEEPMTAPGARRPRGPAGRRQVDGRPPRPLKAPRPGGSDPNADRREATVWGAAEHDAGSDRGGMVCTIEAGYRRFASSLGQAPAPRSPSCQRPPGQKEGRA